jgi:hypothetical protein
MELAAAVLVRDESYGAFVTHSFRQQSKIPCFTCALGMCRESESISLPLAPIVASRFSTASATVKYDRVSPAPPSALSPARPSAEIPPVRRLIGRRVGGWEGMGGRGGGIIVYLFFLFFIFFLFFVCF